MFDDNFSDTVTFAEDVPKMGNPGENISLLRSAHSLSIEKRQSIAMADTIFYSMSNMKHASYVLEWVSDGLSNNGLSAFLEDKYLHTKTPVSLKDYDTTDVTFTIDTNAASIDPARFRIIFQQPINAGPVPVTFIGVKATQQNKNIAVEWNVNNQLNIKEYDIEKSTDGIHFSKVNTTTVTNSTLSSIQYNWIDAAAVKGDNYYRIVGVSYSGMTSYSEVVKVKIGEGNAAINVYPNPIKGGVIGLQFTNLPVGFYSLRLVNDIGQDLLNTIINHPGGSAMQTIQLNNTSAKGSYSLEVTYPDKNKAIVKLVVTIVSGGFKRMVIVRFRYILACFSDETI